MRRPTQILLWTPHNLASVGALRVQIPTLPSPGGLNVIRKEAWLFCRTNSGVRLCWELEAPNGPKGPSHHDLASRGAQKLRQWSRPHALTVQGYLAHKKQPPPRTLP